MPRFPKVSGEEVIKILELKGYERIRTRGSHVRLYPPEFPFGLKKTTVPLHKQIKPGTIKSIMKDAELTLEDFK
jgi:predicted RNA binding protein YcfA (HicA-like mRNA interferase family)